MKAAIVVLADTETYEGLGRVANALMAVHEFQDAGDEVRLVFDGAGVKWIGKLSDPQQMYHDAFEKSRPSIAGVCQYCANAFQVRDQVEKAGVPFADDYEGHPSFRTLVKEGFSVITF